MQYEALKALQGDKIYLAPLKDPKRILDVGTGTGIWPIEMGTCIQPAYTIGKATVVPSGCLRMETRHS